MSMKMTRGILALAGLLTVLVAFPSGVIRAQDQDGGRRAPRAVQGVIRVYAFADLGVELSVATSGNNDLAAIFDATMLDETATYDGGGVLLVEASTGEVLVTSEGVVILGTIEPFVDLFVDDEIFGRNYIAYINATSAAMIELEVELSVTFVTEEVLLEFGLPPDFLVTTATLTYEEVFAAFVANPLLAINWDAICGGAKRRCYRLCAGKGAVNKWICRRKCDALYLACKTVCPG